jgi:hypothetical protein
MPFPSWVLGMFWRGLTTAPPVISSNWAGVLFGSIVFAVKELNSLRQNHWRFKGTELLWSVVIGFFAWIALATVNTVYIAYKDHMELSSSASVATTWQRSAQILAEELHGTARARNEWKSKAEVYLGRLAPRTRWIEDLRFQQTPIATHASDGSVASQMYIAVYADTKICPVRVRLAASGSLSNIRDVLIKTDNTPVIDPHWMLVEGRDNRVLEIWFASPAINQNVGLYVSFTIDGPAVNIEHVFHQ